MIQLRYGLRGGAGKSDGVAHGPALLLHARLWMDDGGSFYLADGDSISGTYINYTAVNTVGSPLCHGDLIHIGQIGYRFTSAKPKHTRQPAITSITQPDEQERTP